MNRRTDEQKEGEGMKDRKLEKAEREREQTDGGREQV